MLCLTHATDPTWVKVALADLDRVLIDHAHCELKAAANAMSLVTRAGDRPKVARALLDLAEEELRHFRAVYERLERRSLSLGPPPVDAYAAELRKLAVARNRPAQNSLVDRLLIGALIEARSCERFRLLAEALREHPEAELGAFYDELFAAEARHYRVFIDLAIEVSGDEAGVRARLAELAEAEGRLSQAAGLEPSVHG